MEQQKLQLAVAKAAFSASLSLPSEPKVSPQLVSAFQSLLATATSKPSQRNIKENRIWILETCHSAKQVTAAVRFLSALSATLPTFKERLALLHVINDVLFHSANTFRETKEYVASAALQYLPALVKTIRSAPDAQAGPLRKVIKLWSEKNYFSAEEFKQITEEPLTEDKPTMEEDKVERKPLMKPSMLGNLGDPHWLLPVSCMLEVVEFSNNYKSIFPAKVKAIKLSPTTDPEILARVENFETSVHEWKFKEEEGSEGEEFDGEGWNLASWSGIEQRRLRRTQESLRRQLMEKVGRLNKPTTTTRGRSPSPMEGGSKRSRSRSSSWSRSRSRSPRRRRERSNSYSPPRRKRGRSRSVSRSPSPRERKWSPQLAPPPPPPTQETIPSQPHQYLPSQPPPPHSYPGVPPPQPLYQYNIPPQNYQAPPPQQYSYPPPPPSQTGYYRADGPPVANAPWEQRGFPPSGAPPWQQPPTGPQGGNYGRGDYAQRGHSQHRKWL